MRSIALAIAAVLLLASCSDEPEPIEPTDISLRSHQPNLSLPKSAREDTPSGAADFVGLLGRDVQLRAHIPATVGPMLKHSGDCKPCEGYANRLPSNSNLQDRAEGASLATVETFP